MIRRYLASIVVIKMVNPIRLVVRSPDSKSGSAGSNPTWGTIILKRFIGESSMQCIERMSDWNTPDGYSYRSASYADDYDVDDFSEDEIKKDQWEREYEEYCEEEDNEEEDE
jgi:hypothetical protein